MYMDTIGGADNFCLQKSSMPIGRIGVFKSNIPSPIKVLSMYSANESMDSQVPNDRRHDLSQLT